MLNFGKLLNRQIHKRAGKLGGKLLKRLFIEISAVVRSARLIRSVPNFTKFQYQDYSKMCKKVPIRGALIVLEGCDRSGKTTQCKQIGEFFVRQKSWESAICAYQFNVITLSYDSEDTKRKRTTSRIHEFSGSHHRMWCTHQLLPHKQNGIQWRNNTLVVHNQSMGGKGQNGTKVTRWHHTDCRPIFIFRRCIQRCQRIGFGMVQDTRNWLAEARLGVAIDDDRLRYIETRWIWRRKVSCKCIWAKLDAMEKYLANVTGQIGEAIFIWHVRFCLKTVFSEYHCAESFHTPSESND